MKVLRKILALLVVLALFGGGATYALTPSESINNSEKLVNHDAKIKLEDLNRDFISNLKLVDSNIKTSLKINNNTFLSIFKNAVSDDSQLLDGSYKLVDDHIKAKLPVKLGLWDTMINTNIKVTGANNSVDLILEDAKIGKVPIPNFALEKYLKEALSGSGARVNGNTITITIKSLDLPVVVDNVEVTDSNINVTASLSREKALKYAAENFNAYRRV